MVTVMLDNIVVAGIGVISAVVQLIILVAVARFAYVLHRVMPEDQLALRLGMHDCQRMYSK